MERSGEQPEASHSPEIARENVETVDIFLQRHGERGSDGLLTEEGVEQVRNETSRVVEQYLSPESSPVTFFVLNSPSATFINGVAAGRRAEHSGQVAAEVIQHEISKRGLSEDKAQLHEFGKTEAGTRAHKGLREPNYFYVDNAENPTAYFDALIDKLGKEGREEGFFQGVEELEDLRKEVGAESSADVASRMLKLFRVIDRYAQAYRGKHPDRKLVFLLESHGDVIRSTIQHGLGVDASKGWQPRTGESLKLEIENGEVNLDYNGMKYEVELGAKKDRSE
jgi:broad specificity phosphatase PhoE